MKMHLSISRLLPVVVCATLVFCSKNNSSSVSNLAFDSIPVSRLLTPLIHEVSGIADSHINPGFLWAQEDSGNPPQIYLVSHDGVVAKRIFLEGITNRDWEDMAVVNHDIYIAETGDNAGVYPSCRFYKFPEPTAATDTVRNIETISFTYPDGPHDAEAFLVDPVSKDILVITKRDQQSLMFRLSYPYSMTGNNAVTLVGSLPYTGVVSAAMSADGTGIIVKTYGALLYYKRKNGESIRDALQGVYATLHYVVEPQGEAVGFAADDSGFFTMSEQAYASWVNLYFYKRH